MATELNVALQIDARANIDALQKTIDELKAAGGSSSSSCTTSISAGGILKNWAASPTDSPDRFIYVSVRADAERLRDQLNETSAEAERLRKITAAKITLGLANDEDIKRRIEAVAEAYRTLQEDGTLSQEELTRAAELYSEQLADLERQLGSVSHELSALEGYHRT